MFDELLDHMNEKMSPKDMEDKAIELLNKDFFNINKFQLKNAADIKRKIIASARAAVGSDEDKMKAHPAHAIKHLDERIYSVDDSNPMKGWTLELIAGFFMQQTSSNVLLRNMMEMGEAMKTQQGLLNMLGKAGAEKMNSKIEEADFGMFDMTQLSDKALLKLRGAIDEIIKERGTDNGTTTH